MTPSALGAERRKPSRPQTGWSDTEFARIADTVHVIAGLVFAENRQAAAEAAMRRTMGSLRLGEPTELLTAIQAPGAARDALITELTVGESYFFRDFAQLGAIEKLIAAEPNRPLSVWSAGCASGEEPYSIAIRLREIGAASPVAITATDIAKPRLEAARRGAYTRWALRGVSDARVTRWFTRRDAHFYLDSSVRSAVEFSVLNLVDDDPPVGAYDVVVCRNVMIYFDLAGVARVAAALLRSLKPDGYLVLGASDPLLSHFLDCSVVKTPAGLLYRRADASSRLGDDLFHASGPIRVPEKLNDYEPVASKALDDIGGAERAIPVAMPATLPPRTGVSVPSDIEVAGVAYARRDYVLAEAVAERYVESRRPGETTAHDWSLLVRAAANQARLTRAADLCQRALDVHPMSPELQYLYSTLLAQAGWFHDAATAARRAIYLDPAFAMAHFAHADSMLRSGRPSDARRSYANALEALAPFPDLATPPAADGISAARLRQIATLGLNGFQTESAS